jgi:hypothetical protein
MQVTGFKSYVERHEIASKSGLKQAAPSIDKQTKLQQDLLPSILAQVNSLNHLPLKSQQ